MGRSLCSQPSRRLYSFGYGSGGLEQIDEERRLLYVAMTQAREHLHLLQPLRFYLTNQHRDGRVT